MEEIWIGYAKEIWLNRVCEIWRLCFGDSSNYARFFFSHLKFREQVLVLCIKGCPVSMLSILWADTKIKGVQKELAYFYAVATHPNWQRRGFGSKLLEFAAKEMEQKNRIPILVPATEKLALFYKKKGFTEATNLKWIEEEGKFSRGQACLKKITAEEYYTMRNKRFFGDRYIRWSLDEIAFRLEEAQRFGGFAKKVCWMGKEYAMIGMKKENHCLELTETTIPEEELIELAGEIGAQMRCQKVRVYLPENSCIKGEVIPFSMIKGIAGLKGGYFNLALN